MFRDISYHYLHVGSSAVVDPLPFTADIACATNLSVGSTAPTTIHKSYSSLLAHSSTFKAVHSQSLRRQICSGDSKLWLLCHNWFAVPTCGQGVWWHNIKCYRKIRTPIPQTDKALCPDCTFREKNHKFKESQAKNFNKRHQTRDLHPDAYVWITWGQAHPRKGEECSRTTEILCRWDKSH